METFNFPYHTVQTTNPESGLRGQFGGSYVFTAPPTDPDQRIFDLHFPVMRFFLDNLGELDSLTEATYNMYTLILFYQRHKLHESFYYNHPVHGQLIVRFNSPLVEPKGLPGGGGAVEGFDIQLMEVP